MRDATRRAVLDAAIELLHEAGVVSGVTHIKLERAARRASYTTGAAYRCWPTQADFHRDLAIAALQWRDRSSIADTVAGIRHLVDEGAPLLEVIRTGAEANLRRFPDETDFFLTLALRCAAKYDDDLAAATCARVNHGLSEHAQLYEALMRVFGRRPRRPFTTAHLAAVIAALADGFAIQDIGRGHERVQRPDLGDGVGEDWTLFATAVQAAIEFYTEPE